MTTYSYREYKAWIAWLDNQEALDNPSRTDWYIIQLTLEVVNLFRKKPITDLKKGLITQKKKSTFVPEDKKTSYAKAIWKGVTGFGSKTWRGKRK